MSRVAQSVERREVLSGPAGHDPASSGDGAGSTPAARRSKEPCRCTTECEWESRAIDKRCRYGNDGNGLSGKAGAVQK